MSSDEEDEELVFHDEVELEDFEFDADLAAYTYPCPCGDQVRKIGHEDSVSMSVCKVHISATRWRFYT
jgi:hypothetical protein